MAVIQGRDDDALHPCGSEDGDKCLHFGCILRVEPTKFAEGLVVRCDSQRIVKEDYAIFSLSKQNDVIN